MPELMGIDFVPLKIPLRRRLQTLAVFCFLIAFAVSPLLCLYYFWKLLLFSSYWWIVALYATWYVYDFRTPEQGSRPSFWVRNLFLWDWFRDYFPIALIKTADLPADRNYIIGYHPHGIFSVGAFTNFGCETTGFSKKFPGITPSLVTLNQQFWFPFRREFTILQGCIASSKKSIESVIRSPIKGKAVVIVVGGAQEVLNAYPGKNDLYLKKRKGFVKLALKHGADLVPTYSFGENDLYQQMSKLADLVPTYSFGENDLYQQMSAEKGSIYEKVQQLIKYLLGFLMPVIRGRGVFNYTVGFMPYRRPINTVGKPITVGPPNPKPSQEEIDATHEKYVAGLKELFEGEKEKYGVAQDEKLIIS